MLEPSSSPGWLVSLSTNRWGNNVCEGLTVTVLVAVPDALVVAEELALAEGEGVSVGWVDIVVQKNRIYTRTT